MGFADFFCGLYDLRGRIIITKYSSTLLEHSFCSGVIEKIQKYLAEDDTILYIRLIHDLNCVPVKLHERALVFIFFSFRSVKEKISFLQKEASVKIIFLPSKERKLGSFAYKEGRRAHQSQFITNCLYLIKFHLFFFEL